MLWKKINCLLAEVGVVVMVLVGCGISSDSSSSRLQEITDKEKTVAEKEEFKYQEQQPTFKHLFNDVDNEEIPAMDGFQFVYNEKIHVDEMLLNIYYYRDCRTNLMWMLTINYGYYGADVSWSAYNRTSTEIYTYDEFIKDRGIEISK